MKIYKTQSEVEADIKGGVLAIEGDVKFECNISIDASIVVTGGNINAKDIKAFDINAKDIKAFDINAWDIKAFDINAKDIRAFDINAWDIKSWDISYWAFLCTTKSLKCKSWKARRGIYQAPICLDGEVEIIKEDLQEEIITVNGKTYKLVE